MPNQPEDTHRLSNAIEGFCGGNGPLTEQLLRDRQKINAIELLGIGRFLSDEPAYSFFKLMLDDLRAVPPNWFWAVWTTPAAYLWVRLALQALQAGTPQPLVRNHAKWLGKSLEDFARDHIRQLGVFGIAARLLARQEYRTPVPVLVDLIGSFPAAGIAWKADLPLTLLGCNAGGAVVAEIGSAVRVLPVRDRPDGADSPFFRVPKAAGRGGIWMDCWDACIRMNYDGMEWSPRVTDHNLLEHAAAHVSEALIQIEAYSSALSAEIGLVLSVGCPLRAPSDDVSPSGSISFIPGAFFFANLQSPDRLAEMIIHEFCHNKLFLLQYRDALLDEDHHGDGWTVRSFYSPWREDPRPVKGILHGLFVFVEIAAFWASRLAGTSDPVAIRRFKTTISQVEVAYRVLDANATFTPVGRRLMDQMRARIDALAPLAATIDGEAIPVLYAELHDAGDFTGLPVNEALRRHRKRFEVPKQYAEGPRISGATDGSSKGAHTR